MTTNIHYEKDIITTNGNAGVNVGAHSHGESHVHGHTHEHGHAHAGGSHLVGGQQVITNQYSQGGYTVPSLTCQQQHAHGHECYNKAYGLTCNQQHSHQHGCYDTRGLTCQ